MAENTARRRLFDSYVVLAGASDKLADCAFAKLKNVGTDEEFAKLLAIGYSAALALRTRRERARINKREKLDPHPLIDGLHRDMQQHSPDRWKQLAEGIKWAKSPDKEIIRELQRIRVMADALAEQIEKVVRIPPLGFHLPSLFDPKFSGTGQLLHDLASAVRQDLEPSRRQPKVLAQARIELLKPLFELVDQIAPDRPYEVLEDLLYVLTAGVTKITQDSLRKDRVRAEKYS